MEACENYQFQYETNNLNERKQSIEKENDWRKISQSLCYEDPKTTENCMKDYGRKESQPEKSSWQSWFMQKK
ncbi:hypothetical protein L3Y34_016312 [Caenorhabditis briggsae]|uniref:Uncharacterized protein n=1 Tax=Caenorhabditis briggsae TaxID=6238 RepID=A0AAE9DW11_CAEBR|nr:hypothetical protein L3Y34_016312 [Caenorhabditis briggsae]